ncbi:anaerobic sulfatase maturase [bacterium]|nr:anaerobic sulfatase maturase [bacterium]
MTERKPLNSVLIKPAGADCNMACEYCFYIEKGELYPKRKVHRMKTEVLEELVRQVMRSGEPMVSFNWQGGEPTLMGLDFYKKAVAFEEKYGLSGQSVGNGFQTNGMLINEEWCKFLSEYKFLVGLSLDGPQHVHDRYRQDRAGRPTWERIMKAAKLMGEYDVACNILAVVNDYSVKFAKETYSFLVEEAFPPGHQEKFLQFIPIVETDLVSGGAASFSVSGEAFGKFLCEIFDCWLADFQDGWPTVSVRFFDTVFHSYVGMDSPECTAMKECGCYVVVEHNGDIYSCDFFVEPRWKLGSLLEGNLAEMLNSPRQQEFGRIKATLPEPCRNCPWVKICRGGCTKDRVRDPEDKGLSHFCASYKMFFEHSDGHFRELAEKWGKNH